MNELVSESLPGLYAHLKYYGVDISTVTFNWFITIFIDAVPFEVRIKYSMSVIRWPNAIFIFARALAGAIQRA